MGNGRFKIDDWEVVVSGVEATETLNTRRPVVRFGIELAEGGRRWKCKAVGLDEGIAVGLFF
jgi:hypothetical protein